MGISLTWRNPLFRLPFTCNDNFYNAGYNDVIHNQLAKPRAIWDLLNETYFLIERLYGGVTSLCR